MHARMHARHMQFPWVRGTFVPWYHHPAPPAPCLHLTHPVFSPASPTTHSSNASTTRGDTTSADARGGGGLVLKLELALFLYRYKMEVSAPLLWRGMPLFGVPQYHTGRVRSGPHHCSIQVMARMYRSTGYGPNASCGGTSPPPHLPHEPSTHLKKQIPETETGTIIDKEPGWTWCHQCRDSRSECSAGLWFLLKYSRS